MRRIRHLALVVIVVASCLAARAGISRAAPGPILATVPLGGAAGAINEDSRAGRVFVAVGRSHAILALDAATGRVLYRVPLGHDPHAYRGSLLLTPLLLATDAAHDRLYVAAPDTGTIWALDTRTGRRIAMLAYDPRIAPVTALAVSAGRVVATGIVAGLRLGVWRSPAGGLVGSTALGPNAQGYQGGGLALAPRLGLAAVGSMTNNSLYLVRLAEGSVAQEVQLDPANLSSPPVALAVDERTGSETRSAVFVAVTAPSPRVIMIDASTGEILSRTPVAAGPVSIAIDTATRRAFVVSQGASRSAEPGTVTVLDTDTGAVTAHVPVGFAPRAIAIDARTARVFVANTGTGFLAPSTGQDSSVSVLDARTGAVRETLHTGTDPTAIAVDPTIAHAFVVNAGSQTISVIDTSQT